MRVIITATKLIFCPFQTEIEIILQKLNKVSEEMKKVSQIDEMQEKLDAITRAMPGMDEADEQESAITRSSTLSSEARRYM